MHCLGAWNRVMFAVILDDLVAFTCIPRIFEGSELVFLGAEVACTGFILARFMRVYFGSLQISYIGLYEIKIQK